MTTRAYYGQAGYGPAIQAIPSEFDSGAYRDGAQTNIFDTQGYSGVYNGSLSAQGNMVAMQLSSGQYVLEPTGNLITINEDVSVQEVKPIPYCTGYFRTYYKDPKLCVFGANTPMPALTLVMPESMKDTPGNFLYYLDMQMTRITGSNYFDLFHFISLFYQATSWVYNSNNYISALNKAADTNLEYYGANSYKELITQGLVKYQQGMALKKAIRNVGFMLSSVPEGYFGTPNAVAKTLMKFGLGGVGNLSNSLEQAGVNFSDMYDPMYTPAITQILTNITNPSDLQTIQSVMNSTIPNMKNCMAYCSISDASGLNNDSVFRNMAEMGNDLFYKAPNFTINNGAVFAAMLDSIQNETGPSVEALATQISLLTPEIIASLRGTLPVSIDNKLITVLNVIGSASGYLIDYIQEVNKGIAALYATSYGPQLRYVLSEISRRAAQVPLNKDQIVVIYQNPNYWQQQLEESINQYYALLQAIVSDKTGNMPLIVKTINENYQIACEKLRLEYLNYNKANFNVVAQNDLNILMSFVSGLPSYGEDAVNIGTDYLLYGMAANNAAGDLVRTLLGYTKNLRMLTQAGFKINGII